MALTSGTKLGPYEIVSPLGAGGMGEVYRARDTRLERIVAVKILPAHLSSNPEARQRFEREAKAISSLSHPNICHLYDVGAQDGLDYIVMEYLEGETLADRLKKGPLPVEQLLRCAIEIAEGLDKAHRSGVVHRDLKPGNIMLTKSGAKLMDFGLAKAAAGSAVTQPASALTQSLSPAQSPIATSPTAPLTAQGMIVGTFQYMSPEQVEGKEADARSDIFSFGTVLYEMATGKRAFEGKSAASAMAAILERDPPPITSLQPMTPPALDRVIKKCLAKEPEKRWQAASDLADELKWIGEGGSQVTSLPAAARKGNRALGLRALIGGFGIAVLVAAIASLATWNLKPSAPRPVTRTVITLPPGQKLAVPDQPAVALSPDGNHLVYAAIQGSTQQLYLRAMDSLESRPIPGTEGAVDPFFSPDNQWVGFFADGKLKKISVSGGAAQTLADAVTARGASWSSQGVITFSPTAVAVLQQLPDAGGKPQPLTRLGNGENSHGWPDFMPDGKAVLFTAAAGAVFWSNGQIAVHSLVTGERRNFVQLGTQPRYAASGHLIYAQAGNLMAVPFDSQRLAVTGPAVPVVEGVLQSRIDGAAQYSLSATGSLVYVSGGLQAAEGRLVWVNRHGTEQLVAAPSRAYMNPRLSPDGRRAAVMITELESQLWQYDFSRDTLTRLTFGGSSNQYGAWSPDGKRIAFRSNKEGTLNIFWQLADGSGGLEMLTTSEHSISPNSWSSDGQLLAVVAASPTTGLDIDILRVADRKLQPFLQTPFNEGAPGFSPDGRWLVYVSDESGRYEVYVQPYPGPGGKWQVSTEGGTEPLWNRNGRELFYRSGDKMMSVDIATQPSFSAGKPHVLFEGKYQRTPVTFPAYDVTPDGQRFLMLKASEETGAAATQINVVLNWFEELKRRVPSTKSP